MYFGVDYLDRIYNYMVKCAIKSESNKKKK